MLQYKIKTKFKKLASLLVGVILHWSELLLKLLSLFHSQPKGRSTVGQWRESPGKKTPPLPSVWDACSGNKTHHRETNLVWISNFLSPKYLERSYSQASSHLVFYFLSKFQTLWGPFHLCSYILHIVKPCCKVLINSCCVQILGQVVMFLKQ